jgi:hypothetical protein
MSELSPNSFTSLVKISGHLYCVWKAGEFQDLSINNHGKNLLKVIESLWHDLEDVILEERQRYHYINEEMRKLKEGFSYIPRPDILEDE